MFILSINTQSVPSSPSVRVSIIRCSGWGIYFVKMTMNSSVQGIRATMSQQFVSTPLPFVYPSSQKSEIWSIAGRVPFVGLAWHITAQKIQSRMRLSPVVLLYASRSDLLRRLSATETAAMAAVLFFFFFFLLLTS